MKLILTCLAVLSLAAAAALRAADDAPWPPPEMKQLPADYLERLRHALQLAADEFGSARFKQADVIKVRVGIAGLALGQHVEALNACFAVDGFGWKSNEKFGFSLFSSAFVRLYALFNDRTGVLKGRLAPQAQANLEKSFWACAKVYGKLTEAQRDVWMSEGSENHHVTSKVSDFLVAQFLKDLPAYAGLRYDDGSTLRQQYETRRDYWHQWLDQRARRGLFTEDGSSYENYTIEALLNLRDFAEDPVLRRKADMFLDLVFANFAEETLGSVRGGPKSRTKEEGFEAIYYGLLFNQGAGFRARANYFCATSSYYPAPAIVALAREAGGRGAYAWSKRCPGFNALAQEDAAPEWRALDREHSLIRNGFATAQFHLGSHAFDATAKVLWQSRQQRWQGVIFANHPLARISMDGKSAADIKSGYISHPFKTIQDRNIMVTTKWGPVADEKVDPKLWIYFSAALDTVEEAQGWIFVKSGGAFAAVNIVGGHAWVTPWKHSDQMRPKSFVRLLREEAPVITVINDAADYNGDFRAFQQALMAQPVTWTAGVLQFATITHEGALKPGKISGQPVGLAPALLNDSPFIRSAWDSGVVYIRKGDETLKLDFSDPRNPQKTVRGPITPAYPPGAGHAQPLVFGSGGEILR